jgi:metallo-beta-lactamase family protein
MKVKVKFLGAACEVTGSKYLLQIGDFNLLVDCGEDVPVRAKTFTINGLSAHADRDELLRWLSGFWQAPQQTFIVHGEAESANALASALKSKGWNATVPHYLENVELFKQI